MKPTTSKRSGFIQYIAKRDGAVFIKKDNKLKPATINQRKLIQNLLSKYPDIKTFPEYKTYKHLSTIESSSELICSIEENYYNELSNVGEYITYIAQRPRVIKSGTHGLFSDTNDDIILQQVKDTVANNQGNIWTTIVSLKREDAVALGFNDVDSWKSLIRSKRNTLSKSLKIDPDNFEWFASFHDESHHPHVHIVMYAKDGKQGYMNKQSINDIRSSLANEIFKDEMLNVYKQQTEYRDNIKLLSKDYLNETVLNIKSNIKPLPSIDEKLIFLSKQLKQIGGRKSYGYLPKKIKDLVDEIVDEVSNDENIEQLLQLWFDQKNSIQSNYSDSKITYVNISSLSEFKSIKNYIIKIADDIDLAKVELNNNSPQKMQLNTIDDYVDNMLDNQLELNNEKSIEPTLIKLNKQDSDTSNNHHNESEEYYRSPLFSSIKLLYLISRIIEDSLNTCKMNSKVDYEILKNQKLKKIALGHNPNEHR